MLRFNPVTVLLALTLGASQLAAQANVGASAIWIPADPTRSHMDRAGVWDGTTEVTHTTGDTLRITLTNSGNQPAFDILTWVELPAGFEYVPGSATVTETCAPPSDPLPTVSAVQVGTDIQLSLSPAGYDLPAGCSLQVEVGIRATAAVGSGTYQARPKWDYALTDGGPLVGPAEVQLNLLIQTGATTLTKSPSAQVRAIGETATWEVIVRNTGLGGLFDVHIDESSIDPGPSLQLLSMVQTAPALPAAPNPAANRLTLPHLAPGGEFRVIVQAIVTGCSAINNVAGSNDRTLLTELTVNGPVALNLQQPLVAYTPGNVSLDYDAPVLVTIPVDNLGLGAAVGLVIDSNLNTLPLDLVLVGADWSYNPANGNFTYTGGSPAGTLANAATTSLQFTLQASDICAASGAGGVVWRTSYANTCGDVYSTPTVLSSVLAAPNAPGISLGKSASVDRLAVGDNAGFDLTLSASNREFIATDPLLVVDTLPATIVDFTVGPAPAGTSYDVSGQTITWTVPLAALDSPLVLPISFEVTIDPCEGGNVLTNTASLTALSTAGCDLSTSASASLFLTNNPGATVDQYFAVTPAPDGAFETGNPSADGVRDPGEGEFIGFTAVYEFGPAYPGIWAGSTYEDDFAGLSNMTLVPGSLQISVNGNPPVAVPPAAVTQGGPGALALDLSFVEGASFANDPEVKGHAITITYQTTAADADLNGGTTRSVLQRIRLNVTLGAGDGACLDAGSSFTQGDFYSIARAAATIGVSMPNQLSVCETFPVTLSVGNATVMDAKNLRIRFSPGAEYRFVGLAGSPYAGAFNAGNLVFDDDAANDFAEPSWTFTPPELTAGGSITVLVGRRALSGTSPGSLQATVDYDDEQTRLTVDREFSSSTSAAPLLIRQGTLALTTTPATVQVVGDTIQWLIYVTNTGDGPTYSSTLTNILPAGGVLVVDEAATNALNAPLAVNVGMDARTLTWSLGDMQPGESRLLYVVASIVPDLGCSIPDGENEVIAEWGCGGESNQVSAVLAPNFRFPPGQMQVVHDTTQSFARMCDEGSARIIVRNTGAANIANIVLREIMDPASGLALTSGSVEVSLNGGPFSPLGPAGDPTGTGTAADPYTWTSAQIAQLATLVPVGDPGTHQVVVRFALTADETVATASPTLQASATGVIACGNPVDSPGVPFTIPTARPSINLQLDGRNETAADAAFAGTVYGGVADQVTWRIRISNTGTWEAKQVRITFTAAGSDSPAPLLLDHPSFGAPVVITSGDPYLIPFNIVHGSTETFTVTEILGNTCVNALANASVAWGCTASDTSAPGNPVDAARLNMVPDFSSSGLLVQQSVTSLPGGRARVDVQLTNNGGTAMDLLLTSVLPANIHIDSTVAPVLLSSDNPSIAEVILGGTATEPTFSLTSPGPGDKILRFSQQVSIRYWVYPHVFDTTAADSFNAWIQAEPQPALDPVPPTGGNQTLNVSYTSTCGGAPLVVPRTVSLPILYPDLDFVGRPADRLLRSDSGLVNYDFTIRNDGAVGSTANRITVEVSLGDGWDLGNTTVSLTTRPGDAVGPTAATHHGGGSYSFSSSQLGSLTRAATNPTIVVRVRTRPINDTAGSLRILVTLNGAIVLQDDSTSPGDYSFDRARPRIVGADLSKAILTSAPNNGTSEADSTNPNVWIGEEVTFRLRARFFGLETGESLTNVSVSDTLFMTGSAPGAHNGLGFVSLTPTASQNVSIASTTTSVPNLTSPPPVINGRFVQNFDPLLFTAGQDFLYESDLVARVLNIPENVDGQVLRNNFGARLSAISPNPSGTGNLRTWRSNQGVDGFGSIGGTSNSTSALLHRNASVTVRRPALQVEQQVRNLNAAGPFASSAVAQAGDILEFRVVLTNPASAQAPLYDVALNESLDSKLLLLAAPVGADTTGDDAVDIASTGGVTPGPGGSLSLDHSNTTLPVLGQNLERLDPGQSVTLLFRAEVASNAFPNEVLLTAIGARGDSLPGPSGNQSAHPGTEGNPDGALVLNANASVPVTIITQDLLLQKEITGTSVAATAATATTADVAIGEQVEFTVSLVLPVLTVPSLVVEDQLPAGLELIEVPVVTIGPAIENPLTLPTITPAGVPASGNPLVMSFDFGDRLVVDAPVADRTITIRYVARVRNVASNQQGVELTNLASYRYGDPVFSPANQSTVTLTVVEPEVTVSKSTNLAEVDAGDVITFTVTVDNTTGASAAWDLALADLLPSDLAYVAGSTTLVPALTQGFTGTLAEPDVAGKDLAWGREQAVPVPLHLEAGGRLVFTYEAVTLDSVKPETELTNSLAVTWTSLEGSPGPDLGTANGAAGSAAGERDGSGGINSYSATAEATVEAPMPLALAKSRSGDSLPLNPPVPPPADGFRIGDIITFTLTATVPEGTIDSFRFEDTLPDGLELVDFDPVLPASGDDGFSYSQPVAPATAPAAGSTGVLSWSLGTVVNEGDNDPATNSLNLVFRARVLDHPAWLDPSAFAPAAPVAQTGTNSARLRWENAASEERTSSPDATADFVVRQPRLELAKDLIQPPSGNVVMPGESARFHITVTNDGTGPAYNLSVTDLIPQPLAHAPPVMIVATLGAQDITADLSSASQPVWSPGPRSLVWTLSDTQVLLPGDSLTLTYEVVLDPATTRGQTLENSATVDAHFSQPSSSPTDRRAYPAVGPAISPVVVGMRISGFVYHDTLPNGTRDGFESWATGVPVHVNLIHATTGTLVQSILVPVGLGDYVFTHVAPGNYRLIVTPVSAPNATSASAPPPWLFRAPPDGTLPRPMIASDSTENNFGLYPGTTITGRVFRDDGAGGGSPNDGDQQGAEAPLPGVAVRLLDAASSVLATAVTDGTGDFVLFVPDGTPAQTLRVVQTNLPAFVSTGGRAGDTGGSYDRDTDTVSFPFTPGISHSGLLFGDVPTPAFLVDNHQTILPGQHAVHGHIFTAGTAGTVTFSTASVPLPPSLPWSQLLYLDLNGNALIDPNEPLITGPIPVSAGETIAIIVRDEPGPGAAVGAQFSTTVTATFVFTGANPPLSAVLTRTDLTVIGATGAEGSAGLELRKEADKAIAFPGETITYAITYTNRGPDPIRALIIRDQTPAFTTFVSIGTGPLPDSLTAVTEVHPTPGQTGSLRWTFDGELQPGASGTVTFAVQIDL